jgi:hypothetical protein
MSASLEYTVEQCRVQDLSQRLNELERASGAIRPPIILPTESELGFEQVLIIWCGLKRTSQDA